MEYTVDYFIKKFEAIPSWRWTTGRLNKSYLGLFSQHCAMGHCNARYPDLRNPNTESYQLHKLVATVLGISVVSINDGRLSEYQQKTSKERVLAALYDVKAIQNQPKEVIIEKIIEKVVYVTVDKEVRELQEEELILN